MKKFEKYGTLLTRSEAKEIRGGGGDANPQHPIDDQGDPGSGGNNSPGCDPVQPNVNGQMVVCNPKSCSRMVAGIPREGTCGYSAATNDCFCFTPHG